jgi:hypothetical protein
VGVFKSKKQQPVETGRRRPVPGMQSRPASFSYYSQSQPRPEHAPTARRQPIPRSKNEVLQYIGQRFGVFIALFAAVALLLSSIQVSSNPRIRIVNDTEVYHIHSDALYQKALSRHISASWTNSNKITINTDQLAKELKSEYPELADVSVALPVLGQRPIAYLQMTRPSLLLVTPDSRAYVLDETGRVMAPASQVARLDSFKLPTISDQSGLNPEVGKLVLAGANVSFIRSVTYQLQAAHVSYDKLVLPEASQELDVYLNGRSYFVKFNAHDNSAREQAGAFLAVQQRLEKQGTLPTAYVDVRLPGRAYYK